ncbi:MAG: DUF1015 domain-containing protein [Anaerolineales bacterium]|nr:DUF1015 domain-containing protein [Anaerolineales bacterium]MCX7609203.1 DUF1015 domain-containing protein [Anaerolineales bacterium]MDW8227806.1 DUF1015 domain-containing protein [Anaerolineales bacterium]
MRTYEDIAIAIPEVYLPRPGVDLTRWAVIAVDQFTSQPEYWRQVEEFVGDAPSTLHLILPEIYLDKPGEAERIQRIQATMHRYLEEGLLQPHQGMIYVERTFGYRTRKGLLLCLDLEHYDYTKSAQSLIRATEGTILERLPPRMKIRAGAPLELPHILVLIDDPDRTVIEPLAQAKSRFEKLYDFDLMLGSGHLTGYAVDDSFEPQIVAALRALKDQRAFMRKYNLKEEKPVLLFAMGDGNHSLATAKAIWEKLKPEVGLDHPARYALVEIENVHDEALVFEPIHRVLFGVRKNIYAALQNYFGSNFNFVVLRSAEEVVERVEKARGPRHTIGVISDGGWVHYGLIEISNPKSNLPVGTLQAFLDEFMKEGGADTIDYVHGREVVIELGSKPGNVGFYVPGMDKSDLFKTVILDGALPRKTFSMGEAREKRFYLEARKIV